MIKKLPKHKTYLADRKLALVEARDRKVGRAYVVTEGIGVGQDQRKLYQYESRRNDLIQDCARLWSAAIGLDEAKHWSHAVPQALYDTLESFDTSCSIAAAIGFLEAQGYIVTKKQAPNVVQPGEARACRVQHGPRQRWIRGTPDELRAGMYVIREGHGVQLVGDVNEQGGVCDCCHDVDRVDVIAYTEPEPYPAKP